MTQEEKERAKIPLSPSDARPARVLGRGARRHPEAAAARCGPGARRLPQARRGRLPRGPEGALRAVEADFGLAPDAPEGRRREALARWLTDRRNPLTARVFVNRLWYHHFGQGLVETPSDFGFNGGRPSHPELLDYLASRFVDGGWKIKEMHRLIVTSAAYRQESRVRDDRAEGLDAENRLLWRANRRRLEGEAVRDAALAVSGALNRQIGGPSFRDVAGEARHTRTTSSPTRPASSRTPSTAARSIASGRDRGTTRCSMRSIAPTRRSWRRGGRGRSRRSQALSMSNNPFMEKCAERFAARVRRDAGDDAARQVERAWRLAFARPPSDREARAARSFVAKQGLDRALPRAVQRERVPVHRLSPAATVDRSPP